MPSCLEKGENTTPTFQTVRFEGVTGHINHTESRGTSTIGHLISVHLFILSSISVTHPNPRLSVFPFSVGPVKTWSHQ